MLVKLTVNIKILPENKLKLIMICLFVLIGILVPKVTLGQIQPPQITVVEGIVSNETAQCNYKILWSKTKGDIVYYKAQCSDDPTFKQGMLIESLWISDTTFIFNDLQFEKKYYFRTKSQASRSSLVQGDRETRFFETGWSQARTGVMTSILSINTQNKSFFKYNADVTWSGIPGDDIYYQVECANDSNFKEQLILSNWTRQTRIVFDDIKVKKKYYFRVRIKVADQIQNPSRIAYISTPLQPILISGFLGDFWADYFAPGGSLIYVLFATFSFGLTLVYKLHNNTNRIKAFPNDQDEFLGILELGWKRNSKIEHLQKLKEKLESQYQHFAIGRIFLDGLISHINNPGSRNITMEVNSAIENSASVEKNNLEKWHLNTLWGVSSLCPLLGLLGTVVGILLSFGELQQSAVDGVEMAKAIPQLAGGINLALITTVWGLFSGIILYGFYYYFRARSDSIYSKWEEMVRTVTKEF